MCVLVCNVCLSGFLGTACGGGGRRQFSPAEESTRPLCKCGLKRGPCGRLPHVLLVWVSLRRMLCVAPCLACEKCPSKALFCTLLAYLAGRNSAHSGNETVQSIKPDALPSGTGVGVSVAASPNELHHSNVQGPKTALD